MLENAITVTVWSDLWKPFFSCPYKVYSFCALKFKYYVWLISKFVYNCSILSFLFRRTNSYVAPPPWTGTKYIASIACLYVCLISVLLTALISKLDVQTYEIFCACCLWPWLGPPSWRQCNRPTSCIYEDDNYNRVAQLKWYQLTFLLVTFECPNWRDSMIFWHM